MSRIVQRGSESLYVQESLQYSKVVLRHNCLKHSRYVTYCLKHKNLPSQFEILQVRQTVTETQQVCRRLSEIHIPVLNIGRLLHKLSHVQEIPQKPSERRVPHRAKQKLRQRPSKTSKESLRLKYSQEGGKRLQTV